MAKKYILTQGEIEDKTPEQKESLELGSARTGLQKTFGTVLNQVHLSGSSADAWKAFWGLRSHGFPKDQLFNGNEALRFIRLYKQDPNGALRSGEEIVDEAYRKGYTVTLRTEFGTAFGRAEALDEPAVADDREDAKNQDPVDDD